jgi:ribonuclease PH
MRDFLMRNDGRATTQMRNIRITPNFTKHAKGSVLVEYGDTKVICSVFVDDQVPHFLRGAQPPQGWLTAEYGMLPSATNTRTKRERPAPSGRTQEIQRLIGRSLRGVIDLKKCPEITLNIDCDVIQADGGTRTASITGAYVALKIAVDRLLAERKVKANPLFDAVAAVSIGIRDGEFLLDLNYEEDSSADLDMNVVMTESGKFLEIQGTAEKQSFTKEQVQHILELAEEGLKELFPLQALASSGQCVEL